MSWRDRLRAAIQRQRRCGNYFEWPDQRFEELGAVETLLESWGYGEGKRIQLSFPQKDPPDVVGIDIEGKRIAFEVTELMDEEAARRNAQFDEDEEAARLKEAGIDEARARELAKRQAVIRDWTPDQAVNAIRKRLERKDKKTWHGGPYDRTVLLMPTDEFTMDPEEYVPAIEAHRFTKPNVITEAYVLFSYDPRTETHPVAMLRFKE